MMVLEMCAVGGRTSVSMEMTFPTGPPSYEATMSATFRVNPAYDASSVNSADLAGNDDLPPSYDSIARDPVISHEAPESTYDSISENVDAQSSNLNSVSENVDSQNSNLNSVSESQGEETQSGQSVESTTDQTQASSAQLWLHM